MNEDQMKLIEDASRLTAVFGRWPSFHNSEVMRVVLDRTGSGGPSLETQLHVLEMTDQAGAAGH